MPIPIVMRFARRRLLPKTDPNSHAIFHIVSRVVDRRFIFGPKEKAQFLVFLRRYERFCRVQILSYCLMDNHFHLLVKVPGRPDARPSQVDLMQHVRQTLGGTIASNYQARIEFWTGQLARGLAVRSGETAGEMAADAHEAAWEVVVGPGEDLAYHAAGQLEKVSQDIWQRMYDLSRFVLSVKQRFSHWFNQENDRKGTLWEERFQAVAVQDGTAVAEIAAYMDLNPVRAGLVQDAKDYPWSQYGAAVAGDGLAQQALEYLVSHHTSQIRERMSPVRFEKVPMAPLMGLQVGFAIMQCLFEDRGMGRSAEVDALGGASSQPTWTYTEGAVSEYSKGVAIGDADYLEAVLAEHRKFFGRPRVHTGRGGEFTRRGLEKAGTQGGPLYCFSRGRKRFDRKVLLGVGE